MKSLSQNTVINFISQLTTSFSAFFISIILARLLDPHLLGQFSFFTWIISTIALVATLGLPTTLTRYVSKYYFNKDENTAKLVASQIFLLAVKISVGITAIFLLVSSFGFISENKLYYYIIAITFPFAGLNIVLNSLAQGLQKYSLILKVNLLTSLINLVITISILLLGGRVMHLLLLNFVILVFNFAVMSYLTRDFLFKWKERLPKNIRTEIINFTKSLSIITFIDIIVWQKSEIFFLNIFTNLEQVAFYSLAFGVVGKIMFMLPGAISGVIMPKVAALSDKNDGESIKDIYFASSRYLMLITIPLIVTGYFLSDQLVFIIYGEKYLPVANVLKILFIAGGLGAIAGSASAVVYGSGNHSFILKSGAIVAIVNIILDLLLIPHYQAVGAALANSSAQILGVMIGLYFLVQVKKMSFPFIDGFKIMLAAFISIIASVFISNILKFEGISSLLLIGITFIILFLLSLKKLKFFSNQDFEVAKKLFIFLPKPLTSLVKKT